MDCGQVSRNVVDQWDGVVGVCGGVQVWYSIVRTQVEDNVWSDFFNSFYSPYLREKSQYAGDRTPINMNEGFESLGVS